MTYELACELVLMMIYELFHELMVPMMEQMMNVRRMVCILINKVQERKAAGSDLIISTRQS